MEVEERTDASTEPAPAGEAIVAGRRMYDVIRGPDRIRGYRIGNPRGPTVGATERRVTSIEGPTTGASFGQKADDHVAVDATALANADLTGQVSSGRAPLGAPGRALSDWLTSGDLPPAIAHAFQHAASSFSKKPQAIVDKLNKILAVGVTSERLTEELAGMEEQMSWRGSAPSADLLQMEPLKLLSKVYDKVTIFAGDFGIDPPDVEVVRKRQQKRREAVQRVRLFLKSSAPAANPSDNVLQFGDHKRAKDPG